MIVRKFNFAAMIFMLGIGVSKESPWYASLQFLIFLFWNAYLSFENDKELKK